MGRVFLGCGSMHIVRYFCYLCGQRIPALQCPGRPHSSCTLCCPSASPQPPSPALAAGDRHASNLSCQMALKIGISKFSLGHANRNMARREKACITLFRPSACLQCRVLRLCFPLCLRRLSDKPLLKDVLFQDRGVHNLRGGRTAYQFRIRRHAREAEQSGACRGACTCSRLPPNQAGALTCPYMTAPMPGRGHAGGFTGMCIPTMLSQVLTTAPLAYSMPSSASR